jgi:hypothetical protein
MAKGNEGCVATDLKNDALRDRNGDTPPHKRVKSVQNEGNRSRAGKLYSRRVEEKQGRGKLQDVIGFQNKFKFKKTLLSGTDPVDEREREKDVRYM